ncbi:hypothetical protein ISN44_As08g014010 [Arabidopsis suecica]|uniref:HMA domain-containing protein n=1 Tax=Arabidopsis suecica TaxID=45249 RepID=A0A8T2B832_ARASU|nr:hypothetical protein ISN44_As08g014010 [Arabidopsis suecica]
MDYTVDMSCVMKVNRSCELCRQKVSEVMHCVNGVYSVDFVSDDNSMKLKARVNPNILLAVIERYGEHGKITNLRFDGEVMTPRGGGGYYGQSGYYIPSTARGNYAYPSLYPYPPPPYVYGGNYAHPASNPPRHTEAPRQVTNPHTTPPSYSLPAPPSRPVHSYAYVEPQYRTSGSSGKGCVIM